MFTALMLVLSPVPQEPQQSAIAPEVLHRAEPGIAGGFDMANPGHRMLGSFSEKGVSLEGDGWSAGLALAGWGRAGEMSAAVPVEPRAEGCRVEYHRPGITEWYVNGPRGLEQGFTVAAAPAGDGPVRIQLAIDGGLEVEVLKGARDARLLDDDGRAVFHYVGLTAWDATGRHLGAALSTVEGGLALEVLDQGAVYPLTVDPWMGTEVAVLAAEDGDTGDHFGTSVALQGDTLVVGAYGVGTAGASYTGAAYVLYRDQGGPGAWGEVAKLTASVPASSGYFGWAVALDGDTLVVGARGDTTPADIGSAYVFERNAGAADVWGEVKKLVGNQQSDDDFGGAVAIDGDTIVIGAGGENAAFAEEGAVYVFGRNEGGQGNWGLVQCLSNPTPDFHDRFGSSVAVEGDNMAVGVPNDDINGQQEGSVEVFERIAGVWTGTQQLTSGDGWYLGWRHMDIDGDSLLVGAPGATFGSHPGAAYSFERIAGAWVLTQKLTASTANEQDFFGDCVALSGDTAIIGAPYHDGPAGSDSGAAYLFRREGGSGAWSELQELTASNGQAGARYGSVAFDGGTAAIGAPDQYYGADVAKVRSAAFDALTSTLYGVEETAGRLIRIDTSTGAGTGVGPVGFTDIHGLAFDPGQGILYATSPFTDELIEIDTSTGMGQAIATTGFNRIIGLAYDTSAGVLYGFEDSIDSLVRIDPATGATVAVGPLPGKVSGLDYDPSTDTLYGTDVVADQLLVIDRNTGASTVVGSLGFPNVDGLAIDPLSGTLYGVDSTVPPSSKLITINTASGAGSLVGELSTYKGDAGAVYVVALDFEAETYCTAGTSASGCQALIGATGTASATASSGFSLLISGIEGQKDGLFFYGTNGRQANPWGNGTSYVCVVPPRLRGGLLTGVGTLEACDGAFDQDLNANWCPTCPKPNHNPGAGALVQAQMWYRDPLNTSNQTSSMSDAIEFLVGP